MTASTIYRTFPRYRDISWLPEREDRLCRDADVVFCTSRHLWEQRRELNPERTFLVHNVGDAEHFGAALDPATEIPSEAARIAARGPIIGFVGAVSGYKVDLSWLEHLARQRPGWQLMVIGPVGMADPGTDVGRLEALPNVHLLGHRPYAQLPSYLKAADVTVIPYRLSEHTASVFPIKFFEFMATGAPVVISALPALREFWDQVLVAEDAAGFVARCEQALCERDDEAARQRRLALAQKHSWPERVRQLMEHVERALELSERARASPRAS